MLCSEAGRVGSQRALTDSVSWSAALSERPATVRPVTATFEIRDVSSWDVVNPEPIGRDAKLWLREPGAPTGSREQDWLFKPVVTASNGHRQGEDWAEKVVSELGGLLGVPCAEIELAERNGEFGSISRNVTPDGWSLVLGSELLSRVVDGYQEGRLRSAGRPGHSPHTIIQALARCEPAPGPGALTAPAMFAGYLVLDAWVANQDRHDQNWAVIHRAAAPGELRLAASYDHASGLGFNLRDARREALRAANGVEAWARGGVAHRFEHDPALPKRSIPTLVETAHHALDLGGQLASHQWTERLRTLEWADVENVVAKVPQLSDPTATFILDVLSINRRRLLHER